VDQDLKVFLEGLEARIEARFDRMEERFNGVDERFNGIDERFNGIDERLDKVEAESRQTRVLVEGLRGDIHLLGEGVMGVSERLEKHQDETARGFQEVKAMLAPYYRNLDGRALSLEDDVQHLNRRVKLLENKADRQTGDVLDAIRKKFGPPRA
jgi:tetrahydromethanopterin S-methyltransferase subunit G